MKKIVCEICESQNLKKVNDEYVCQECGTTYSLEQIKKLLVDVEDTSTTKSNEELENLYELARRAKSEDNVVNALKYYTMLLEKKPYDWEASFYQVYFQGRSCKLGEIATYASRLANSVITTISLIKNHVETEELQYACIVEVTNAAIEISNHFYFNAKNHYNNIAYSIRSNYTYDLINNVESSSNICLNLAESIESNYIDKLSNDIENRVLRKCCADLYSTFVVQRNSILSKLSANYKYTQLELMKKIEVKIKNSNPNYVSILNEKDKKTMDPKSYATAAIVCAILFPLIGLIIGIDGLNKAKTDKYYTAYQKQFKIAIGIIVVELLLAIIIAMVI